MISGELCSSLYPSESIFSDEKVLNKSRSLTEHYSGPDQAIQASCHWAHEHWTPAVGWCSPQKGRFLVHFPRTPKRLGTLTCCLDHTHKQQSSLCHWVPQPKSTSPFIWDNSSLKSSRTLHEDIGSTTSAVCWGEANYISLETLYLFQKFGILSCLKGDIPCLNSPVGTLQDLYGFILPGWMKTYRESQSASQ